MFINLSNLENAEYIYDADRSKLLVHNQNIIYIYIYFTFSKKLFKPSSPDLGTRVPISRSSWALKAPRKIEGELPWEGDTERGRDEFLLSANS